MSKAHEAITERIIAFMEQGTCPWRRPWNALKTQGGQRPRNIEGRLYRGCNWFLLGLLPFEHPAFLTFNQAKQRGGMVKKGEKGFPVVFWKMLPIDRENEDGTNGKAMIPMAKLYTVFNIAQTTLEQPASQGPTPMVFDAIHDAEAIVSAMPNRPAIHTGFDRAFYRPATDDITMPGRHLFLEAAGFYETLFHELGHSTGHVSRLGRKEITQPSYFGSHAYSLEELVAELTSAFLCAEAGVECESTLENQAAYCKGWLSELKNDSKLFITAAARAHKAADYILNRQAQLETTEAHSSETAA